jgi:hypothetical protein
MRCLIDIYACVEPDDGLSMAVFYEYLSRSTTLNLSALTTQIREQDNRKVGPCDSGPLVGVGATRDPRAIAFMAWSRPIIELRHLIDYTYMGT